MEDKREMEKGGTKEKGSGERGKYVGGGYGRRECGGGMIFVAWHPPHTPHIILGDWGKDR